MGSSGSDDEKKESKVSEDEKKACKKNCDEEVRAYKILMNRHTNDDRLMSERMAAFLVANSFLFAGFAALLYVRSEFHTSCIRLAVSILGIILCALFYKLALRTKKGLEFWAKAERKIEEGATFEYMQSFYYCKHNGEFCKRTSIGTGEMDMTPHSVREFVGDERCSANNIYTYLFPLLFFALWMTSLVWVGIHW